MSSNTLNEFLFDILLIVIGAYAIIKEEELAQIEKKVFKKIKRIVKK
jgi:hypothetical protein